MTKRLNRSNLQISETLVNFIENEALPNTNVSAERFWNKLELILNQFVPLNQKLLETRSIMKNQIDSFYLENTGKTINQENFEIVYVLSEKKSFNKQIDEIEKQCLN